MYENGLLNCTCYVSLICCFDHYLHYMSHSVTRTLDNASTCQTHWSVVARSCTASRRSFTWWTDGPTHEGVGKTLKHHHVQTEEFSIYHSNASSCTICMWQMFKKHMNKNERLGKSLEYWWRLNLRKPKATIYYDLFCAIHKYCLFLCCYQTCFAQFGLATCRIDWWRILGFRSLSDVWSNLINFTTK